MIDRLPFTSEGAFEPDHLASFYADLHESGQQVVHDQATNLHAVYSYNDVRHVLSGVDPRTHQHDPSISNENTLDPLSSRAQLAANPLGWTSIAKLVQHTTPATANAPSETHRMVKKAVYDSWSSVSLGRHRTAHNYGALVERVVHEAADELEIELRRDGTADVTTSFVQPIATRVIGDAIGFSRDEQVKIQQWSDAQTSLLGRKLSWSERAPAVQGLAGLAVACHELIAMRRQQPEADLASLLASERHKLDNKLAGSTAMNLIAAGYATTYGTLQNSIRYVTSDMGRAHWNRMEDPSYVQKLVPELVRLETGLVGWKRKAVQDVYLASGGVIPAGSQIVALIGAANRDPAFAEPNTVKLDRASKPMPLSFGIGENLCMGRELALMELSFALHALRTRFPDLRVADGASLQYDKDNLFRTLRSLPVTTR
jgi:cytochrome P450